MEKDTSRSLLLFAAQQMAAESYLDGWEDLSENELRNRLALGNNSPFLFNAATANLPGNSRFPSKLANLLLSRNKVIDHHANDATGFSATLFLDRESSEYTLSFRSTEYQDQSIGGDWERDGAPGADGELVANGFSFAQLSAMENYYRELKKSGLLPANAQINVTGYSLGGHLATVFTELHSEDVLHTYMFNSPGRGGFKGGQADEYSASLKIGAMLARLDQVMHDPASGLGVLSGSQDANLSTLYRLAVDAARSDPGWEPFLAGSEGSIYRDWRYLWAKAVVIEEFDPDSRVDEGILFDQTRTDGAFAKMTQIVGRAAHNDNEKVSNSQYHPAVTSIFIEDQPDLIKGGGVGGLPGDYGLTHSITLIADTLALEDLFSTLSPRLIRGQIESIFAASSGQHAYAPIGLDGISEGNSLESALDGLFFSISGVDDATPYSRDSTGFGNLENRTRFYERIEELKSMVATMDHSLDIIPIMGQTAEQLVAGATGEDALVYRFALREALPFIVRGVDYAALHDLDGELDIYDPVTQSGSLTNQWIEDRAAMLVALNSARMDDNEDTLDRLHAQTGGTVYSFVDVSETDVLVVPEDLLWFSKSFVTFGESSGDIIIGQSTNDHLYGEEGDDRLSGAGGIDWLEGGAGNDILDGGGGGDWLLGGAGSDELKGGGGANFLDGGPGFDLYKYQRSERGFDFIRDDDGQVMVDGALVTGAYRISGNDFVSQDRRFELRLDGSTLYIDGAIAILDFQNGDLGITLSDSNVRQLSEDLATGSGSITSLENKHWGTLAADLIAPGRRPEFQQVLGLAGQDTLILSSMGRAFGGGGADYIVGSDESDYLFGDEDAAGFSLQWLDEPGMLEIFIPSGLDWASDWMGNSTADLHYSSLGTFSNTDDAIAVADIITGVSVDSNLSTHWNDVIEGGDGDDTLDGGLGSDRLFGNAGDDHIDDGRNPISSTNAAGVDKEIYKLYQGASNDDYLDGGPGNDRLISHGGRDWLVGGDGDDNLIDGALMDGGRGNDFLTIRSGIRNSQMKGGEGDDVFTTGTDSLVDCGTGRDLVIVDVPRLYGGTEVVINDPDEATALALNRGDVLVMPNPGEYRFARSAADLVILISVAEVLQVRWRDWFSGLDSGASDLYVGGVFGATAGYFDDTGIWVGPQLSTQFEYWRFSKSDISSMVSLFVDGWDGDDIFAAGAQAVAVRGRGGDDALTGGDGDDFLDGGDGNDLLIGGGGADVLVGGKGNDVYRFGVESGDDIVMDRDSSLGNLDRIEFMPDIVVSDVFVRRLGYDLVAMIRSSGATVTVQSWFWGGTYQIEQFAFEDGTVWDSGYVTSLSKSSAAPELSNPIADQAAEEDSPFTYRVPRNAFSDSANTFSYTATLEDGDDLPEWLAFDAITQTFSGVPGNIDVGAAHIKLTATDEAGRSAFDSFDISVANSNDAPVVGQTIRKQEVYEDIAYSFQIPLDAFVDVDVGDALFYSLTLEDGGTLPAWLTFEPATRTLRGTPARGDIGTLSLKVTVTDLEGRDASSMFGLVVTRVNTAPTLVIPIADAIAAEDEIFRFEIPTNTFSDVDAGDTLNYTATVEGGTALPNWIVFDSATAIFSGTPANGDVGAISVRITVTDGASGIAFDTFDIVVINTNDAPTLVTPIADQTATEDAEFDFQVPASTFSDVDVDDTLNYTAELASGAALPPWLTFNYATRTFSGTPLNADVDLLSIKVVTTDGENAFASDIFNLVVTNSNDAPTLTIPIADQTAKEGVAFDFQVFADSFGDVDIGDALTYSATLADGLALPDWLTFNAGTRTFSGTPDTANVGALSIRVTVYDTEGATASDIFDLAVQPASPVITGTPGNDTLVGGAIDNFIFGLAGNDSLFGEGGSDTLDGGTGSDAMDGGRGNDIYVVDSTTDAVIEATDEGVDLIRSSVTYIVPVNVENLTLTGTAPINGTGNSLDNLLTGNAGNNCLSGGAGNDTLDGGAGIDTLIGGSGNDTYIVDSTTDTIIENAGEGIDTVQSATTYTLRANLENLVLSGSSAINGSGNVLANFMVGNAGANFLAGAGGIDVLQGMDGNDILVDDFGCGVIDGGSGDDSLSGHASNQIYIGGAGNDVINTGAGQNIFAFNKGSGNDTVVGRSGSRNTISIGGGIQYTDLSFSRRGATLLMNAGSSDHLALINWYAAGRNKSIANLQVIAAAMADFNPSGRDPLRDNKVEQFNFAALVNAFDAAGQIDGWSLTNALLSAHLSGSNSAAIGGDLAYQYGKTGSLKDIGLGAAQRVVNSPQFGVAAQTLHSLADVQQGQIRLS